VRTLLRRGETPTPAAVAGLLTDWQAHDAAVHHQQQRVAHVLAHDGPRAAAAAADAWTRHGQGPTWRELARAMGWPERDLEAAIQALATAGWLTPGKAPRSLRPGPATPPPG
jgi:hypothetical protein